MDGKVFLFYESENFIKIMDDENVAECEKRESVRTPSSYKIKANNGETGCRRLTTAASNYESVNKIKFHVSSAENRREMVPSPHTHKSDRECKPSEG